MDKQLSLFTVPLDQTELRFIKMNKDAITPTMDENGDWVLYAPEDILLKSDAVSSIYSGIRILIDDEYAEARIFNIENNFFYPRHTTFLTIENGFNEDVQIGMYVFTKKQAPQEEIFHSGMWMLEQDDMQPAHKTVMEKKVMLMDGTFEDYPIEVPKNSVLIKRGMPIFVLRVYRRTNVLMTEEFVE